MKQILKIIVEYADGSKESIRPDQTYKQAKIISQMTNNIPQTVRIYDEMIYVLNENPDDLIGDYYINLLGDEEADNYDELGQNENIIELLCALAEEVLDEEDSNVSVNDACLATLKTLMECNLNISEMEVDKIRMNL